ncbi:hypothetical protein EJB05_01007, partial [Eragrostis curvula]
MTLFNSGAKLSLSSNTTSVIVGRSYDGCSMHCSANSATFQAELTSHSPPILGSTMLSISPTESFWRTHRGMWTPSVSLMGTVGGWPVISSSSTTPKLYTSLFSLNRDGPDTPGCALLQTMGRVESNLETLIPKESGLHVKSIRVPFTGVAALCSIADDVSKLLMSETSMAVEGVVCLVDEGID